MTIPIQIKSLPAGLRPPVPGGLRPPDPPTSASGAPAGLFLRQIRNPRTNTARNAPLGSFGNQFQ
eukprot:11528004-Alexandrium_andersonii.AAC.1